jgi:hypothetical protein
MFQHYLTSLVPSRLLSDCPRHINAQPQQIDASWMNAIVGGELSERVGNSTALLDFVEKIDLPSCSN